MKRLAVPVCVLAAVRLARWPYWYSVAVTIRSLLQPHVRAEQEADWVA